VPWRPLATASLLAMLGSTLGGCASWVASTNAASPADLALSARVERALLDDPRLFARHIDVEVEGGQVFLSGYVWSTEDLLAARRIAERVPGVNGVRSELELLVGGRNGR